jgi:hypothetical protein
MADYRRNFLAGGTFFFTVNLAERHLQLLTDHIDELRTALREARRHHPFTIDAMVVLPDHLHVNPVKHQLVARVRDWPYSSFHRMVKLGIYPEDWAGDFSDHVEHFGERP